MPLGVSVTTRVDLGPLKALVSGGIERALREAIDDAAEAGRARAEQLVPVRTGALKKSIRVTKRGALQADITASAAHAVFVELGTRRMRAQPFLKPAAEWVRANLAEYVKRRLPR